MKSGRLVWLLVLVLGMMAAAGCSSSPSTSSQATTSPATTTTTPSTTSGAPTITAGQPGSVTIDLTAQNIAFDKKVITVPAGAQVTINFNNKDVGVPHNFALYPELHSAANVALFTGTMTTGPQTIVYKFTAPTTPGTYYFRCDTHPTAMTGQFIVQ